MYGTKLYLSEIFNSLKQGETNLEDWVNIFCDRIEKTDCYINSFLHEDSRRTRLLKEAKELTALWSDPENRPPLFGLIAGVKDIFRTDGFPTKCGSVLPFELFAGEEAKVVSQLKKSGALILGKTHTTEFAYFEAGPTKNPSNLNHTPGGSSSGSAAAVAAGLCPFAFGTQTIGSIIRPASYCGVAGFKPTYGRISTEGVIPFSQTLDHIGFFTQDIEGAELVASVLCSDWNIFKLSTELPILAVPDGRFLQQADKETLEIFEKIILNLETAGYKIKRIEVFENIEFINKTHRQIAAFEMAKVHESWFSNYRSLYRPHTEKIILEGMNVSRQELENALTFQYTLQSEITKLMEISEIDIWICPSSVGTAPEGINSTGSPLMNLPWTFLGFPVISLPIPRKNNELPIGLQLVSAKNTDEKLFSEAEKIQKAISGELLHLA